MKKTRVLRAAGIAGLIGSGLFLILIDYLKHGGEVASHLPDFKALEKLILVSFGMEAFLAHNIGDLLPWHLWGMLGAGLIVGGVYLARWMRRQRAP